MRRLSLITLLLLFFLTTCNTPTPCVWESQTISKGEHAVSPNMFNVGNLSPRNYRYHFTTDWRYDLGYPDQHDWNKLTGLSLTPWGGNHTNSAMISIRYDKDEDELEFGFYTHQDRHVRKLLKDPALPGEHAEVFLTTPVDAIVETFIKHHPDLDRVVLRIEYGSVVEQQVVPYPDVPSTVREINTWFGGNQSAPHTIRYSRMKLHDDCKIN